jgi:hypothetical protein
MNSAGRRNKRIAPAENLYLNAGRWYLDRVSYPLQ